MPKSLVIVESPAKAKTINKLLGSGFSVMASIGHVKDLPKSKLGVDIENGFTPEYVVIKAKAKTISELKKAGKTAELIYLASDPDREGEAIAWHIAEEIDAKGLKTKRVLINEITERGVKEAIANPLPLDRNKYDAQQARRVLDRLVGYQVSPILWDKVRRGLSAGRVQSVALRLICERERAVLAFKPVEYWSITADFTSPEFSAKLAQVNGRKADIKTGEEAERIKSSLNGASYVVSEVEKKERKRSAPPPFTTSKLQQEAARKLGFTAKKTMTIAQMLYEGVEVGKEGPVGLITYMRTDSTRVSAEAIEAVRGYIAEKYGKAHVPEKPNYFKSRKGAQEAHEAIRPTYLKHAPEAVKGHLTPDQWKLYNLIWNRFLASQMAPAVYDQTRASIAANDCVFNATGSIVKFSGFTAVYMESSDVEEEKEDVLPPLEKGMKLKEPAITPAQHFTQPPPRFTEASLVKELEENGIGRPSTYAAILSTIQEREYVEKQNKQFVPTELGFVVTDLLVESFPELFNVAFTARMEEELDEIAEGRIPWAGALKEFYSPFKERLDKAKVGMKDVKREELPTDIVCDKCGKLMVIKWGRKGKFLACPGYPECKNTKDFETGLDGKVVAVERESETRGECPKCGKPMLVKSGRFGRFLACSAYPECKTTKPFSTEIKCASEGCDGMLVEKRTKKGRTFFGCSNYPKCDYATWKLPAKESGN